MKDTYECERLAHGYYLMLKAEHITYLFSLWDQLVSLHQHHPNLSTHDRGLTYGMD